MQFSIFLTLALAASSSAGSLPNMDITSGFVRRVHNHRRDVPGALHDFVRRSSQPQKGPAPSKNPAAALPDNPATGPATASNLKEWNRKTAKACMNAISQLNTASNPSGLGVCYNLPFLNKKTGVFQAELRIYNVTPPSNAWEGVSSKDIKVAFSYQGATVSAAQGLVSRDLEDSKTQFAARLVGEEDMAEIDRRQAGNTPPMVKILSYVGKINPELLPATPRILKSHLRPNIDIEAKSPQTGKLMVAALSSADASFLNGVFSQSTTQAAQQAGPAPVAQTLASTVTVAPPAILVNPKQFTVPGTTLGIFPIGLIITCIWTGFFLAAVGFGTLGRIQFREQYRRRSKMAYAQTLRTI